MPALSTCCLLQEQSWTRGFAFAPQKRGVPAAAATRVSWIRTVVCAWVLDGRDVDPAGFKSRCPNLLGRMSSCFCCSASPAKDDPPSPPKQPQPAPAPVPQPVKKEQPAPSKMAPTKVYIIIYSMYGHIKQMAEAAKKGVEEVEGVEATIYQVAETLPAEVLEKMHAPPKPDYPIIDPHNLPDADGFLFGFPTRFGMMCAQMKAFFDATGQHWSKMALAGKPAGIFTSTAVQGGGQEVTILTSVTQLAAHGMIYVPVGYTAGAGMFDMDNMRGGSSFGAGTLAGPTGARQPTEFELAQATNQGKVLANVAKKLKA